MTTADATPPVVAIVGPTAAGKSDLSLDLAERLAGEVVNTDSMQVYRGMDIGSAKLPVDERRGITHHLLDLLDVTEPATVADFQAWAREVIAGCRNRGVTPVLVGGSALYARAVLDRFEFPATDAATKMTPMNGRRIVRALEVIEITGRPYGAGLPELTYFYDDAHQIGLDIARPLLDERIALRVQRMWDARFVEEVRQLDDRGLRQGRTASRAIGYHQVLAYLDGEITEEEAKAQTISRTRRFARRQDGWFRKDPRITWVDWDDPDRADKALAAVRAGLPHG